jgi:hypothetical protein
MVRKVTLSHSSMHERGGGGGGGGGEGGYSLGTKRIDCFN